MEDSLEQEYKKKKRTRNIVLLIVGGFVIAFVIMIPLSDRFVNYDSTLALSAKAVNLTCPQTIDEATRLDSVGTKKGRRYFYYYTLVTIEKDSMDMELLCSTLDTNLRANLVREPAGTEQFGENNVIINFVFNDLTGDSLCTVTLKPYEYYKGAIKDSLTN